MGNSRSGGETDNDFRQRLRAEVSDWRDDGLITPEQATGILERYELPAQVGGSAIGNRTVSVIAIMGAALIGLGIIAFIAANWSEIPTLAKLALMVVGTPVIYVAGWLLSYRFGFVRIGTAVILLGAIAFGASIHLVAQTYHVPVNHPNLMPAWFLGVIPLAYIIRSQSVLGLSLIILLVATAFRAQEWVPDVFNDEMVWLAPAYLVLGALIFAYGRLQSRFVYTRPFARIFDIIGLLVVAAPVYLLGFHTLWQELRWDDHLRLDVLSVEYWVVVGIAVLAATVALGLGAWQDRKRHSTLCFWESASVVSMAVIATAMWVGLLYGAEWLWWAFNLVMLAGVLAMIGAGYRWNRAWLINLAVIIFAITLFTRYFEFGFDLLGQSVAFIVAGVILLAGGFGLELLRRRLVSRIGSGRRLGRMSRRVTLLFAALVAAQVIGMVVFAGARQTVLSRGHEVVLQTVPVDPRSLLQGDYAILDYEIAERHAYLRDRSAGTVIYVVLKECGDVWCGVEQSVPRPKPTRVYIRGEVDHRGRLDFGIGTYFRA